MEKEWLQKKLTVEEIEKEAIEGLEEYRPDWIGTDKYKPFGMSNDRWEALKNISQPGDEFWSFSSDYELWSMLCGRAGYSLVRNSEIIGSIVTLMS